ncbi:P-loop containing nucleoside triphosphate hydrolase protein [Tribonema minus]|uniref:P-loop containing nucleoside triphosphate hydrolase protein n=1 Tax=Tribonema minus TaxID=303371 RepID=A0A835Z6T1_9STRA|nr:P-loop containing nucleoside triphosphate hydrolase protein [Tribonema minus]
MALLMTGVYGRPMHTASFTSPADVAHTLNDMGKSAMTIHQLYTDLYRNSLAQTQYISALQHHIVKLQQERSLLWDAARKKGVHLIDSASLEAIIKRQSEGTDAESDAENPTPASSDVPIKVETSEDAETREKFVAMELRDGSIHVLHAGAGAGKTTLSIRLMKSVAERYPEAECIALTFNVAAAADGEAKRRFANFMAKYKLVIVDEAQDLNLVMIALMTQIYHATTTVYVGDSAQAIYGFMECTDVKHTLQQEYVDWTLYTTFRFGQAVCDFVNVRHLCSSPAVAHPDNTNTRIEIVDNDQVIMDGAHTVLVRKWTEILQTADRYTQAGRSVSIDKDKVTEIINCASSTLPSTWDKSLFKKIDKLKVIAILARVNQEDAADSIVLSTVHGFKGLEADRVLVTRAVRNARNDDEIRLLYVAVTRAKHTLYLQRCRSG